MWIDFDDLSPASRVWVFQSDRALVEEVQVSIDKELTSFIEKWSTHGSQMHASHTLLYDCFVIIAADEQRQAASGCSIDAFTGLFKKFGEKYEVSFFDRFSVAHKSNSGVVVSPLNEFKKLIKDGDVTEETIVFNNLILSKEEMTSKWELPLKDSWQKRYL